MCVQRTPVGCGYRTGHWTQQGHSLTACPLEAGPGLRQVRPAAAVKAERPAINAWCAPKESSCHLYSTPLRWAWDGNRRGLCSLTPGDGLIAAEKVSMCTLSHTNEREQFAM